MNKSFPYDNYNYYEHYGEHHDAATQKYDHDHDHDPYQSYSAPAYIYSSKDPKTEDKRPQILDFFGIFPEVSSFNILKLFSIIILIIIVELNVMFNMTSEMFIGDYLVSDTDILFGVGLIGLLLAGLYRYIRFEYDRYKWINKNTNKFDYKIILTLIFLSILFIFVLFEIIVELLFNRGILFIIDLIVICCTYAGGYTLFSGKRQLNAVVFLFLFLIMIMGISFNPDPIMMMLLGALTLLYIELSDGVLRIQQHILKYKSMIQENTYNELDWMYKHMDRFSLQFAQTLGLYLMLAVIITSVILLIQWLYPYIMPVYIGENIELMSVYNVLPSMGLLLLIFISIYYLYPHLKPQIKNQ